MLGVFWNPHDLLLLMGTEIFQTDASWAEKLMKTRISKIMAPTVCLSDCYVVEAPRLGPGHRSQCVVAADEPSPSSAWVIIFFVTAGQHRELGVTTHTETTWTFLQ